MATVAKPSTRAFRLRPDKVDQFVKRTGSFRQNNGTISGT